MARAVVNIIALLLVCIVPLPATAANVDIEKVDGVVAGNKVPVGREISIYIRITNTFPDTIRQIANGFRIYSPDGAVWYPHPFIDSSIAITGEWLYDTTFYGTWTDSASTYGGHWSEYFDPFDVESYGDSSLGIESDTVGFWGYDFCSCSGVVPSQSLVTWQIRYDSIASSSLGATICIDSSSLRGGPSGWYYGGVHTPTWDGPYCFEIVADCCEGFRGNINLDQYDTIDISDLTALVGWMFKSGDSPPCPSEADVDGNGNHDIQDVTHLVGYMFRGGPQPAACP